MQSYRAKWTRCCGTLYKKPCALVIGTHHDFPLFGQTENIIIVHGEVHFHVRLFNTLYFSDHYHAYVLDLTSDYRTLKHSDLYCPTPLHIRFVPDLCLQGQKIVVVKHHISIL